MATTKAKPTTLTAFTCESCCELKPLPKDGCGPCDECREEREDDDADFFNDAVSAAQDAFWAEVAKRYRAKGVTSGDFPPDAHMKFRTACTDAVGEWCAYNAGQVGPGEGDDDDGVPFKQKWDPAGDFHREVLAAFAGAHGMPGWSVTYEPFMGCFYFKHEKREDFQILATPDHEDEGTIAVDAHDGDGSKHLRHWPDIAWPLKDRLFYPNGEKAPSSYRAERFIAKVGVILAECEPRKLVVEYDVTGWDGPEIDNLMTEVCAQAEGNDEESIYPHPDAKVLRSEVVAIEEGE